MELELSCIDGGGQVLRASLKQAAVAVEDGVAHLARREQVDDRFGFAQHLASGGGPSKASCATSTELYRAERFPSLSSIAGP
jgi:hypothetical protein